MEQCDQVANSAAHPEKRDGMASVTMNFILSMWVDNEYNLTAADGSSKTAEIIHKLYLCHRLVSQ